MSKAMFKVESMASKTMLGDESVSGWHNTIITPNLLGEHTKVYQHNEG